MNISIGSNEAQTVGNRFIGKQDTVEGEYDKSTSDEQLTLKNGNAENKIHFGQGKENTEAFNKEISKMADAILDFMVEQDGDITQTNRHEYEDEIMTWLFYKQAKGNYDTIGALWGAIAGGDKKLGVDELNRALGKLFNDDNEYFLQTLGKASTQRQFNDLVDIHTEANKVGMKAEEIDEIFFGINKLSTPEVRQDYIDELIDITFFTQDDNRSELLGAIFEDDKNGKGGRINPDSEISSYTAAYTYILAHLFDGDIDKVEEVVDIAKQLNWTGNDLRNAIEEVEKYEGDITIDDLLHYAQEQKSLIPEDKTDHENRTVITAMNEWGFPEAHVDAVFTGQDKKPDNNLGHLLTALALDGKTTAVAVPPFISQFAEVLGISNSSDDIEASKSPKKLEAKLAYIIAASLNNRVPEDKPINGNTAIAIAKSLIAQENTSLEDIIWALHYGDYSGLTNDNAKQKVQDAVEIMNADNQEQDQRDINASIQDSPREVLKLRSALLNFASQADINQGEVMQMVDDLLVTNSFTTIGELWQFLTGSSNQRASLGEERLEELLSLDFSNKHFQNVLEKAKTHNDRSNILHIYQTAQDRGMGIEGDYGLNYLLQDMNKHYDAGFIAALSNVHDENPAAQIKAVLQQNAFAGLSHTNNVASEISFETSINHSNNEFYVYMLLAAFPEENSDWAEEIISLAMKHELTGQDFLDAIEKKEDKEISLEEAIKHKVNDKAVTDAQREQSDEKDQREQVDTVMTNAGFATSTINDIKNNDNYYKLANIHELTTLSGPTDEGFETALASIARVFGGKNWKLRSAHEAELSYLIFTVANARTGAESGDSNFINANKALRIAKKLVDKDYTIRDVARVLTHEPSLQETSRRNIQREVAAAADIRTHDQVAMDDHFVEKSLERGLTYSQTLSSIRGLDTYIGNSTTELDKINEIRRNRGQDPLSEDIKVRREAAYNALNSDMSIAALLDHDDLQEIFEKPVTKANQDLYRSLIARALGVDLTDGNTTLINNILSLAIGDTDNKEFGISGRNLLAILHMAQAEAGTNASSTKILDRAQELTSYAGQIMDIAQDKGMSSERVQDVLHEILYHNPGGKTGELRDHEHSIQMLEWLSGNDQRKGNKTAITTDNVPDWLKNTKIGYNNDPDTNYKMGKTEGDNFIAETNLEQVDSLTALISLTADDVSNRRGDSDKAIENVWEARNEEDNTVGNYLSDLKKQSNFY